MSPDRSATDATRFEAEPRDPAPLRLVAKDARIDLGGRPLLDGLTFDVSGPLVVLQGEWSAFFRLLTGEAELARGSLTVAGHELPLGVRRGSLGVAPLDPPLPKAFSVAELLEASAELCGLPRKNAKAAALATLAELELGTLASRKLVHLPLAERRAVLIAQARVSEPLALCLELPLLGLDTSGQELVLRVLERALAGRGGVVQLGAPASSPHERWLAERANGSLTLGPHGLEPNRAGPALRPRFTVAVLRNHEAFTRALTARGLGVKPAHEAAFLTVLSAPGAGTALRYAVELSNGAAASSAGILDAALETDAALVELRPLDSARVHS